MGAAATAIRRARGGGREAEPPSRDRKEKGRRRKIRTSASDSRRSACFILCLREPRAPATRTQPTRNRVGSDERELSTPSRARTLKGARRESARGRQRKPLSPSPFFFSRPIQSSPVHRELLLSVPKSAFRPFSGCIRREHRECAVDSSARARARVLERREPKDRDSKIQNALRCSRSLRCSARPTLPTARSIAFLSPASEDVFHPVSVLCARASREAWKRVGDSRRRTGRGAQNGATSEARTSSIGPPRRRSGRAKRKQLNRRQRAKSAHPPAPAPGFFSASERPRPARGDQRQLVPRVPREKERRERGTHLEKLRRREKKRKAKGEKKREELC